MLTNQELRQAVFSLSIIEERGDPNVLEMLLREANDSTPAGDPWGNTTPNQEIGGRRLAAKLAGLLGESRDRCEQAAADIFGRQRHRVVFDAITSYANELAGQSSRRTSSAATKPTQRPTVRIVANREAVA